MDSKIEQKLSRARFLRVKFRQHSKTHYINEAIVLDREALAICIPGHSQRAWCLMQLSIHLWARYKQLGDMDGINEAINLSREALAIRTPGDPDRPMSLNNLAICLWTRYRQLSGVEDLSEAIDRDREALSLRPPGHPHRSMSLNNFAIRLWTRYQRLGRIEDLDESIVLNRQALELRPPGHPHRSTTLNSLAICLCSRYQQLGGIEDLSEAIVLNQEALLLRPSGHLYRFVILNGLAICLYARYQRLDVLEDLQGTIDLDREALSLRPPEHLDRSKALDSLTKHLSARYKKLGNAEDRDEVFRLYAELACGARTATSNDLSAVKAWVKAAEESHHPTTLLAYETALRVLVRHLAFLPSLPQHLPVLKENVLSLAIDAFSACVRNSAPLTAIELLEQGRAVFWNQLTRLRSSLDDVIASGSVGKMLAGEFSHLTSLIRNVLESPGEGQHDQLCGLNMELESVVFRIRKLPGLSRFLLPSLFSDLRRAASDGRVIIVNASKYSCDALVVSIDKDPVHIPLSVTKVDVQELSSRLGMLLTRAKRENIARELFIFLRGLWDRVVSPIVDVLCSTYPPESRIWWCPTAEFSLLPLHAASPYRQGQRGLADIYISSYTPSLSALIRARQTCLPITRSEKKRFVAIGQANAIGTSQLFSVSTELATIREQTDGRTSFTCVEGQDACIYRVTEELGKNQWVHLACHGLPNKKQPFASAFALHDGRLSVQRVIQCDLRHAEFAYLSACHTTVGDEESPDEVIHLAAAMQFAGFRSVIGTMWAVDDAQTSKITSVFYQHIRNASGYLDHTRAAYALWKTMGSVKVPLDQRILYIHLGL